MPKGTPHPKLDVLPQWPGQTIAVLATTTHDAVHLIPVSAPVRAADQRIVLSLHRSRGSLDRLRDKPSVAILILTEGNVAMTARGHARIIAESMSSAPEYAAVAIDVDDIDDHRQQAFVIEAGIDRTWRDENERGALRRRVEELRALSNG